MTPLLITVLLPHFTHIRSDIHWSAGSQNKKVPEIGPEAGREVENVDKIGDDHDDVDDLTLPPPPPLTDEDIRKDEENEDVDDLDDDDHLKALPNDDDDVVGGSPRNPLRRSDSGPSLTSPPSKFERNHRFLRAKDSFHIQKNFQELNLKLGSFPFVWLQI